MNPKRFALIGAMLGGTGLLALSTLLLQAHFQALKDVREYAIPLASSIVPLEHRAQLLEEQVELSELQRDVHGSSAEEQLRTFVLPQGDDPRRLIAFLESAQTVLQKRNVLRAMSSVTIGDAVAADFPTGTEGLLSRPVEFSADVNADGKAQLMNILRLSGLITIGDALSTKDVQSLFALTERDNAATIVPLEKFLATDVLEYAKDPKLHDERLQQALPSEEFLAAFHGFLQSSRIGMVRAALQSDLGRSLVAQKLWPLQFMMVEREAVEPQREGWERVTLTLQAYSRE